jgi:hypothetical protein
MHGVVATQNATGNMYSAERVVDLPKTECLDGHDWLANIIHHRRCETKTDVTCCIQLCIAKV